MKGRTDRVVLREIAGECLLVPTGTYAAGLRGILTLNESAGVLWKKLQAECSREELAEALQEEYGIDSDLAKRDVDIFLNQMQEHNLVILDD